MLLPKLDPHKNSHTANPLVIDLRWFRNSTQSPRPQPLRHAVPTVGHGYDLSLKIAKAARAGGFGTPSTHGR